MVDRFGHAGVGGGRSLLTVYDLATQTRYCEPVESKDAPDVFRVLQFIIGNEDHHRVKLIYSDGYPSLPKASADLKLMWQASPPGIKQSNGQIERQNGIVEDGIRSSLMEAGLPATFWSYAAPCWCHLANI